MKKIVHTSFISNTHCDAGKEKPKGLHRSRWVDLYETENADQLYNLPIHTDISSAE